MRRRPSGDAYGTLRTTGASCSLTSGISSRPRCAPTYPAGSGTVSLITGPSTLLPLPSATSSPPTTPHALLRQQAAKQLQSRGNPQTSLSRRACQSYLWNRHRILRTCMQLSEPAVMRMAVHAGWTSNRRWKEAFFGRRRRRRLILPAVGARVASRIGHYGPQVYQKPTSELGTPGLLFRTLSARIAAGDATYLKIPLRACMLQQLIFRALLPP